MTEEKRNRIVAAITVNAIILIAVLVVVVVYQMVIIATSRAYLKSLREQIDSYQQQMQQDMDDMERLQSEEFLRDKLVEFGWHY